MRARWGQKAVLLCDHRCGCGGKVEVQIFGGIFRARVPAHFTPVASVAE